MFQDVPLTHSGEFNNINITLQTGLLAQQATSAVMATMGETTVLAAVVVGKETQNDYFPLQVIYEERMYASGKIKGSRFIKREGRPSENAILVGRMVDRSVRSLFDKNTRTEIQVIITILSVDEVNPPDTLAVLAASAALKLATDDFQGPVSSVRIGQVVKPADQVVDGTVQDAKAIAVVAPNYQQMEMSNLDLVISGNQQGIVMVEAGANIIEDNLLGEYLEIAAENLKILSNFQNEFIQKVQTTAPKITKKLIIKTPDEKYLNYWSQFKPQLQQALYSNLPKEQKAQELNTLKDLHYGTISELAELCSPLVMESNADFKIKIHSMIIINTHLDQQIANALADLVESVKDFGSLKTFLEMALDKAVHNLVQENILQRDLRLDGRAMTETRKISCQINVLPRTHGSSLFQRGETQVLNVLTLGTSRDAQLLDDMEDFEEQTKRYIHHYNFPAYSVGETGRYIGPGRREIGHGALAEKALLPVLPSEEEFPYTIRLVSECLGSNGSTSMASTCASSLSLMQAGVPVKEMVAGVAMGLILDQNTGNFKVLTDIQGSEDHYGDMDFKVTGTKDGITALQLDNKVSGLTVEILKKALIQAKEGRLHILGIMKQAIAAPNKEISPYAPGVQVLHVPYDKIGEVIGPSGKIIKGIIAKYQVDVDIEDTTGKTFIYGKNRDSVAAAAETILKLIKEYQQGDIVTGKVFRIETYGAFIKIDDIDKEGMIHISQISEKRVNNINDVIKMGQELRAKVSEINEKGQLSLTLK